jgi:predicted metal-binding protein
MNILSLVSQNLDNFYQIQTKCYRNSDTVFFSPIHRTKRGLGHIFGFSSSIGSCRRCLLCSALVSFFCSRSTSQATARHACTEEHNSACAVNVRLQFSIQRLTCRRSKRFAEYLEPIEDRPPLAVSLEHAFDLWTSLF